MKKFLPFLMIISFILVQCKKDNDTIDVKDKLNLKVELTEKKHVVLTWDKADLEGFEQYYIERTEISEEEFLCNNSPEFSDLNDFRNCYNSARSKIISIYDSSVTTYVDSTYSYQANIYYSVKAFGQNEGFASKAIKLITPNFPSFEGEPTAIRIDSSGHYLYIVYDNIHLIQIDIESNEITNQMDCNYNFRNFSIWNHNNHNELCLIYENYIEIRDALTFALKDRIDLDFIATDVAYFNENYLIGFSSQNLNLFSINRENKSVKDYGRITLEATYYKNLHIVDSLIYVLFIERGFIFDIDMDGNLTINMDKELDDTYVIPLDLVNYIYVKNNDAFYNTTGYVLDKELNVISGDKYKYSTNVSGFDQDNKRIYHVKPGTKQILCKDFENNTDISTEIKYTYSFPQYLICQNNIIISVGINALDSVVPHTYFIEILR